jgi:hypothetical protein
MTTRMRTLSSLPLKAAAAATPPPPPWPQVGQNGFLNIVSTISAIQIVIDFYPSTSRWY